MVIWNLRPNFIPVFSLWFGVFLATVPAQPSRLETGVKSSLLAISAG